MLKKQVMLSEIENGMWNTDTAWFDVAVIMTIFAIGHEAPSPDHDTC